MKTWFEYISEEAAKYGLDVRSIAIRRELCWAIERDAVQIAVLPTSDAVEAFVRGVWWARSGE